MPSTLIRSLLKSSADFSDKYKNRVDFLLVANGTPAIALECKPCGADLATDRGQLKSYFNALSGGRVGALTNGLEYEFLLLNQTIWTTSRSYR